MELWLEFRRVLFRSSVLGHVLHHDGLVGDHRVLGEGHVRVLRERGGDGARERKHGHERCDEKSGCENSELSHGILPCLATFDAADFFGRWSSTPRGVRELVTYTYLIRRSSRFVKFILKMWVSCLYLGN